MLTGLAGRYIINEFSASTGQMDGRPLNGSFPIHFVDRYTVRKEKYS